MMESASSFDGVSRIRPELSRVYGLGLVGVIFGGLVRAPGCATEVYAQFSGILAEMRLWVWISGINRRTSPWDNGEACVDYMHRHELQISNRSADPYP